MEDIEDLRLLADEVERGAGRDEELDERIFASTCDRTRYERWRNMDRPGRRQIWRDNMVGSNFTVGGIYTGGLDHVVLNLWHKAGGAPPQIWSDPRKNLAAALRALATVQEGRR